MKPPKFYFLFVTCPSGLENLLLEELSQLNLSCPQLKASFAGVECLQASMQDVYRINYCSRLAGRVLLSIARFDASSRENLYQEVSKINWFPYIPKGKTFAIDSNVVQTPAFRNSLFAAQVTKDAICDQFMDRINKRPDVNVYEPDIQIHLFIFRNRAILSIDTSGSPLFKRNYRKKSVAAPLQETLAASILRLSKYSPESILLDPCCGSGTFIIEALLIASKTPPGFLRDSWGFFYLPQFSQEEWLAVKHAADSQKIPLEQGKFFGIDRDYDALEACRRNLETVGLLSYVELIRTDFHRHQLATKPNYVICNPPYGKRLSDIEQLKHLYRHLGELLKKQTSKPAKGVIFSSNIELIHAIGLEPSGQTKLYNGGLEAYLTTYDLPN